MSDHTIHLIGGEDDETATLTTEPRDGRCHITFRYRDRIIEASATDYFEAFSQIRLQLEPERLIPLCYGASLNVFPSGMARDMGSGLSAYRLTIGRRASRDDLVRIFDSGLDVVPASVVNQKQHYDDWIQSPKV
ncbi:MAG TPA: hypothetical protein VF614_05615 [Chthoniobacteraceae bacterium]|jgi:hypothetical protein